MKKFQKELERYFQPPLPKKKEEFLRQFGPLNVGMRDFWLIQIGYIQKSSWVGSLVLMAVAVAAGFSFRNEGELEVLRKAAVFMPFLVLVIVREAARSKMFHMMELELTTRHRLEEIILVRIASLSVVDFLVFLPVCMIFAKIEHLHVLQVILYLSIPFLVTTFLSLLVIRISGGKNGVGYCLAVSIFMSVGYQVLGIVFEKMPGIEGTYGTLAGCMVLCAAIAVQLKKIRDQMGEMAWNS